MRPLQTYSEHYDSIVQKTSAFSMSLPQFQDLQWRIDVSLARRSAAQDASPKFMLNLGLTDSSSKDGTCSLRFQSDHASMKHILDQLEAAVLEERSVHARRFQKYVQ